MYIVLSHTVSLECSVQGIHPALQPVHFLEVFPTPPKKSPKASKQPQILLFPSSASIISFLYIFPHHNSCRQGKAIILSLSLCDTLL